MTFVKGGGMGGLSLWHWIIVFVVLGIPAAFVGLIIWMIVRVRRRPAATSIPTVSQPGSSAVRSPTEARLQELAGLRSKGLISDFEYEQQRAAILSSV